MTLHLQTYGSGWALVVLPSFGLDQAATADVMEPVFADLAGWRRLYLDLPGTGASPPGVPRSDAVADEVVATIGAELGDEPFAILGFPRQISGLMMVCACFKIRPEDRDLTGVAAPSPEPRWLTGVPPALHEHLTHAVGRQTAEIAERIAVNLARNSPSDEAYLVTLRGEGFTLSDEGAPTPCDAPVCFLTGHRDRVVGFANLVDALDSYEHASYTILATAGHYLPLEHPAPFASVTQSWLAHARSSSTPAATELGPRPHLARPDRRHAAGRSGCGIGAPAIGRALKLTAGRRVHAYRRPQRDNLTCALAPQTGRSQAPGRWPGQRPRYRRTAPPRRKHHPPQGLLPLRERRQRDTRRLGADALGGYQDHCRLTSAR